MIAATVQRVAESRLMPEPFQRTDRKGWWYYYKDGFGKWRQKKGGDTKEQAWAAVIATERVLQPVKLGMIDAKTHQQQQYSKKPISEVIIQFERHIRGKRRSQTHIKGVIGDICTVFGVDDPDPQRRARRSLAQGYRPRACNWTCLADISATEFGRFLDDVASVRSAARRNRYRTSINHLVNWAVGLGWMAYNPLKCIDKLNEDKDRRRVRRALSEDEVVRLIDTTRQYGKKNAAKRALYYWVAFRLGLRWSEINRLRRNHLDLSANCLILDASVTKNAKCAILPIPKDLSEALRVYTDLALGLNLVKSLNTTIFKTKPSVATWKRDLARADIGYQEQDGCAYRGATRTTFGTHLYQKGADLRTAQELMRHSDPKLTANVYQRVRLIDTQPTMDKFELPKKSNKKGLA